LSFFLRRDDVIADLGIVRQTYYRWLGTLLKKGYIKRLAYNYYALRPYTAIVGKMANIDYFEEG
jgi:DNA-binding IclR family transcriptional regulator